MRIRNVILDWSGTMVDDLTPVLKTTNHVLRSCGQRPLSRAEFRREFCLPVREFYRERAPHLSLAELERIFLAEYVNHRDEIQLLPHTRAFLEDCARARRAVFVASSADAGTYDRQMGRFDLHRFITKPYIGLDDKTRQIHRILDENRLVPHETLFVGDMEHDIAAGQAGGVHTCAVLSGYSHANRLRARQPDLICEHLGELQTILNRQEHPHGTDR
jgi:phosphoglycolate phosphatase-like HAD superfamily hydrolase